MDGYAPEMDEDDGTMSAWYIFSQIGLYPVCVGTDRYELFTPLFDRVTLHLKDHDVRIVRKGAGWKTERVTGGPQTPRRRRARSSRSGP